MGQGARAEAWSVGVLEGWEKWRDGVLECWSGWSVGGMGCGWLLIGVHQRSSVVKKENPPAAGAVAWIGEGDEDEEDPAWGSSARTGMRLMMWGRPKAEEDPAAAEGGEHDEGPDGGDDGEGGGDAEETGEGGVEESGGGVEEGRRRRSGLSPMG